MVREEAPRAGRPRSESCRLRALEATADLLEELPYREVTIEGIAERASCSKQTIYKWWRSRSTLCMEAYAERTLHRFTDPPEGPVRDKLVSILTQTCRILSQDNNGCIVAGFIAEAQSDPDLAREFRDVLIASRRKAVRATLARGVEDGELRADLDLSLTIDLLYGPIWYRLLLRNAPLDDAFAETVVNCLWPSMKAP